MRDSLDIISSRNFTKLMDNSNMETIALEKWRSQYDVRGSIMACSSAWRVIKYDSLNKPRDCVRENLFFNPKHKRMSALDHHLFQFNVWKRSMMAKLVTETFFNFALAVIFQYYLSVAIKSGYDLKAIYDSHSSTAANQEALEKLLAEDAADLETFYTDMQVTIWLSAIFWFYPVRIYLNWLFAAKSQRKFKAVTLENIIDLSVFISMFIRLFLELFYY